MHSVCCHHLPNTSQYFSCVLDSEKLVLCGCLVKVGSFLVYKEIVWHPNQVYVLCSDHQFFQPRPAFEGEAGILPELTEIHVECEVLKEVKHSY